MNNNSMLKTLVLSTISFLLGTKSLVPHAMDINYYSNLFYTMGLSYDEECNKPLAHMVKKGYTIYKKLGSGLSGTCYMAKSPDGKIVTLKFTTECTSKIDFNLYECYFPPRSQYEYLGDTLIFDKLAYHTRYDEKLKTFIDNHGIVDFGPDACKILGYEIIGGVRDEYNICIILEYINGTGLETRIKSPYQTTDVLKWIKDICESLKLMYENNFLHRSIGIANVMINDKGSAILVDYERAYFKDEFEKLLKKGGHLKPDHNYLKYYDYYDLQLLCYLVRSLITPSTWSTHYTNNDNELHKSLLDLADCTNTTLTLDDFLQKVDKLYVKFIKSTNEN